MIEELEAYITSRGPKARRFLTRAAKDMSEEQQLGFLQQLQLGDTEFQAEVAPYMPKGAKIDPSRARLKRYPVQEVDEKYANDRGVTNIGSDWEQIKTRDPNIPDGFQSISIEPNTVNAIQARNANPQLWAHEYKHLEDLDGGSEYANRIMDVMASQNHNDVAKSIRSTANIALATTQSRLFRLENDPKYKGSEYDAERKRLKRDYELALNTWTGTDPDIREGKISEEELYDHLDNLWDISSTQIAALGVARQSVGNNKASEGKFFKRWKDRSKAVETPEDYREGGRVRLI